MAMLSFKRSNSSPAKSCTGLMACYTRCCTGWNRKVGFNRAGAIVRPAGNGSITRSNGKASKPLSSSANNGERFRRSSRDYGRSNMFNLENAIKGWRRQLAESGITSAEILDELEGHLRDEVEEQMRSGETPENAFKSAITQVGHSRELGREF